MNHLIKIHNRNVSDGCLWKEDRYIFMGAETSGNQTEAPKPPKQEGMDKLMGQTYEMEKYNEQFKTGEFLTDAKKTIVNAISKLPKLLDKFENAGVKLQNQIAEHAYQRLGELDKSYKEAVNSLENSLHDDISKIKEAFENKANEFALDIVKRFSNATDKDHPDETSAVQELRYADMREKMYNAQNNPQKLDAVKTEVVKYVLTQKGEYNADLVNALAPYIGRKAGKLNFGSVKDLQTHFEILLSKDRNVMKDALENLIKDSPSMRSTPEKRTFIRDYIEKKDYRMIIGNKESVDKAVLLISQQLHIEFGKDKKPLAYVDMLGGDRTPQTDGENGLKNKIDQIIKDQFGSKGPGKGMDDYEDRVSKKFKEQEDHLDTLRNGWGSRSVDDISDLKGNKKLEAWVNNSKEYRQQMALLRPFEENTDAKEGVANALRTNNAQVLRIAEAARDNNSGNLSALFKLIGELLGKGEYGKTKLNDVERSLKEGKDPVAESKDKARKNYESLLKDSNPNLSDLLQARQNPKKFFQDLAEKEATTPDERKYASPREMKQIEDRVKIAKNDASMHHEEGVAVINEQFNKFLGGELQNVTPPGPKGTIITFKKGSDMVALTIAKDGKMSVQYKGEAGAPQPFNGTMEGLKTALNNLDAAKKLAAENKAKTERETGEAQEKGQYKNALKSLVRKTFIKNKNGQTDLQRLVDLNTIIKNKPDWNDLKAWKPENGAKGKPADLKQIELDNRRVAFIMKNFDAYRLHMDGNQKFAQALDAIKKPKGQAPSTPG